jgi:hypothetical protein
MAITKEKLVADFSVSLDGDSVVSFLRDGDGNKIESVAGALKVSVDGTVTVSASDLDIRDLSAAQDNVAISDGTDTLAINADGSINSVVTATDLDIRALTQADEVTVFQGTSPWVISATDLDIRDLSAAQDNVAISDGTNTLAINNDGSINIVGNLTVTEEDVYAEDSAHVSGDKGTFTLSVREDVYASSTSADGDYQSFKTDSLGRMWVNHSAQSAIVNGAASVSTSSALLVAATAGRRKMLVQNLGNKAIFIGGSGVATSDGIRIAAGGNYEIEIGDNLALHAVAESGTQDIRYLQLA